ncbi:MAG: RNA polymerase sigma factor [Crocinitomicaceae bacterium]|nr:MAG: RNA polymerase sigma factor [Crocinitomicaceae bacterium]
MTAKEYNSAVDMYADNVFRFVMKHIKNEMSAQDIIQEAFMKVWIKREEIQAEKVKSYLFTTAYHCLIDWINKEKRSGDIEKVENNLASASSLEFDVSAVLDQALNRLPEIQKTVVLLRDYEGYNYAEIAEITQLNESQVKVYIFRARQALKGYLKARELVA